MERLVEKPGVRRTVSRLDLAMTALSAVTRQTSQKKNIIFIIYLMILKLEMGQKATDYIILNKKNQF